MDLPPQPPPPPSLSSRASLMVRKADTPATHSIIMLASCGPSTRTTVQ